MPKTEVVTEDVDDWGYSSVTERRLHTGSLIERLGSFVPARRKGYSMSRTENTIMKRNAKHLYNKRIGLAKGIVNSRYEKRDEILNSALLNIGLAPNSADGWRDYVFLLSEREGGWPVFVKKLRKDVDHISEYQKTIIVGWAQTSVFMIFSFLFPLLLGTVIPDLMRNVIQWSLLALGLSMIFFTLLRARSASELIKMLAGGSAKHVDGFVTAENARSLT